MGPRSQAEAIESRTQDDLTPACRRGRPPTRRPDPGPAGSTPAQARSGGAPYLLNQPRCEPHSWVLTAPGGSFLASTGNGTQLSSPPDNVLPSRGAHRPRKPHFRLIFLDGGKLFHVEQFPFLQLPTNNGVERNTWAPILGRGWPTVRQSDCCNFLIGFPV